MDSQTSQTGNVQGGFTLIELMAIIVIIGLVTSFIVVQSVPSGKPTNLRSKLQLTLTEMSERSLLEQKWYGLQVEENRYRVVCFDKQSWIATSHGWQSLPENAELSTDNIHDIKNNILIYSNLEGILSQQRLILSTVKEKIIIEAPNVFENPTTS